MKYKQIMKILFAGMVMLALAGMTSCGQKNNNTKDSDSTPHLHESDNKKAEQTQVTGNDTTIVIPHAKVSEIIRLRDKIQQSDTTEYCRRDTIYQIIRKCITENMVIKSPTEDSNRTENPNNIQTSDATLVNGISNIQDGLDRLESEQITRFEDIKKLEEQGDNRGLIGFIAVVVFLIFIIAVVHLALFAQKNKRRGTVSYTNGTSQQPNQITQSQYNNLVQSIVSQINKSLPNTAALKKEIVDDISLKIKDMISKHTTGGNNYSGSTPLPIVDPKLNRTGRTAYFKATIGEKTFQKETASKDNRCCYQCTISLDGKTAEFWPIVTAAKIRQFDHLKEAVTFIGNTESATDYKVRTNGTARWDGEQWKVETKAIVKLI